MKSSKERRQKRLTVTPVLVRALFKNVNGNEASLKYIQKGFNDGLIQKTDLSLTYGEVVCASFLQILSYVATSKTCSDSATDGNNRIFYDLGCGTGRAVICAALSPHQFQKVIGIELIPELLESALEVNNCLQDAIISARIENAPENRTCVRQSVKVVPKPTSKSFAPQLDKGQLIRKIRDIIAGKMTAGSGGCSLDFVSNELTKQLGHKVYKLSLQPFGKFSKFMKDNSEYFSISDDDLITILSEYFEAEKEILPKEEPLCADDDAVCAVDVGDNAADISCVEMRENVMNNKAADDSQNNGTPSTLDVKCQDDIGNSIVVSQNLIDVEGRSLESKAVRVAAVQSILCGSPGVLEALLPLPEIEFILGSIFDHEWYKDADVVYAASLLFTDHMMHLLSEQAMKMKKGSWLISLKPLSLITSESQNKIVLREKSFHRMSWQMAEVFIYQVAS